MNNQGWTKEAEVIDYVDSQICGVSRDWTEKVHPNGCPIDVKI